MWGRISRRASKSHECDRGRSKVARVRRRSAHDEKGFTLIELIIVVTVMPIIVGAISAGLVTVLSLQSSVSGRLGDSGNAQIVSSTFIKDVQSATFITTEASTPQCGSDTQLLGLQWGNTSSDIASGNPSSPSTLVSYDIVPVTSGSTTTYSLVREYCTLPNISTPTSSTTVSYDIADPTIQPPPCTAGAGCNPYDTANGHNKPITWTSPSSVPVVNFEITELNSGYKFTMTANSLAWTPPGANSGTVGPAFSPLTLLSQASGTGADLNMSSGSILTITGTGTAGTTMALASPNDSSASISGDAALAASTVFTEDSNLASLTGLGLVNLANVVTGTPQYYASSIPDPFVSTYDSANAPPASSAWPLSAATPCSVAGSTYTCLPGEYSADPGFPSGSTVCFCGYDGGGGYGNYEFDQTFKIPLNSTITFNQGEYVFDGGKNGSPAIAPDSGAGATTIIGNNVVFYVPPSSGTVNFGIGSSVDLTPFGSFPTIWDLSSIPTSSVTINNVANNRNTYGEIYIPGGAVNATNSTVSGTMSVMYIIAQALDLTQPLTLNVTGP